MVPLRFVASSLNINVQWFDKLKVANLGSSITEDEASRGAKPYSGKVVVIDPDMAVTNQELFTVE